MLMCKVVPTSAGQQQVRGMATLKAISVRLKSVKNIQKITQSMKMVSAAKYSRAERELNRTKPIGEGATQFYEKAEIAPTAEKPKKLLVAITSDRGLCGAVHTTVSKSIKEEVAASPDNVKIICVGDKSRLQLQRQHAKSILGVCNEIGKRSPSFLDASKLSQCILNSEYDFNEGKIVHNKFKSVVSYAISDLPLFTVKSVTAAPKINVYDSLDDGVIQSYLEFSITSLLFYAMKEGTCSEESSRMTAMDNASKNADEMIGQLTLSFNRMRQAVITRDLIEITSGAAALD